MRFVEATGAAWTAEQLRAAEAELEAQKREWEANRLAAMQKEEQLLKQETEAEELLTYSRKDASNQVNTTKQDQTSLSKRTAPSTSGAGAAGVSIGGGFDELGIRLTKNNKRDKRFKHHGVNRGGAGAGLNRSLSNKQISTTTASVQQVSPVRTRRNSLLNVGAPARSSGNNSKKADVPARRQTRLHSLGGATATPPTRKTTRTAIAAAAAGAGGTSAAADTSLAAADEQRPKRQSANIAMSKLMKTPVKTTAVVSKNTSAAKARRRVSVSLTSTSAGQKKLLERRATISAPMALKQMKRNKSYASGVDDNEDDKDEHEDDEAESVSVEIDETEADEEEETILSASASPSAQGDTTQTEDEEEMHVKRSNDEADENDEEDEDDKEDENDDEEDTQGENESAQEADSDADVNVETQSSSSYVTAGDGAKSLDAWSAHDQVQDTTMTTSTYYNVSEESDTDDPNDPLSLSSKAETKSEIKESTPAFQRQRKRTSSSRSRGGGGGGASDDAAAAVVVGHTPRTRSRGSVKINLWKLDVSPVLSTQKPSSAVKVARRSTPRSETSQTSAEAPQKRPVGRKSLTKKTTEQSGNNQTTKLTRWITKTPRGRPRSTGNNPSTTSADNSSNGAGSSNR